MESDLPLNMIRLLEDFLLSFRLKDIHWQEMQPTIQAIQNTASFNLNQQDLQNTI
jgi:hypothetical protein